MYFTLKKGEYNVAIQPSTDKKRRVSNYNDLLDENRHFLVLCTQIDMNPFLDITFTGFVHCKLEGQRHFSPVAQLVKVEYNVKSEGEQK